MILAQAQLDAVPAGFVKWFFVTLFVLILVTAAIVGMAAYFRKPAPQRLDDHPPIEVRKAAPRYNHPETQNRFGHIEHRLERHDHEITSIWNTMRSEDKEIRKELAEQFQSISRALGRIEGALGGSDQDKRK